MVSSTVAGDCGTDRQPQQSCLSDSRVSLERAAATMHARMGGKHKVVQMQLKRERPAGAGSRALPASAASGGGRGTQHHFYTQQTAAGVPVAAEEDGGGVNGRGDDDAEQHPPPTAPPPLKRAKARSLDLAALTMPGDWPGANPGKQQHQQPKVDAAALATHQGSAAASATG